MTGFLQKKPDIRQHRKIKKTRRDGSTIGKRGAINEELIR
jgi:hypothetical protein